MRAHLLALLSASFLFGSVACSSEAELSPDTASSDLTGGVDVSGNALEFVGSIVASDGTTTVHLCTGTLLSARGVITSKRCIEQRKEVQEDGTVKELETPFLMNERFPLFFVTGPDIQHPTHKVAIDSVELCREPDSGGVDGYGCNLAIVYLRDSIYTWREPIIGIHAAVEGQRYSVVSYGDRTQVSGSDGVRHVGSMTLRSLEGEPLKQSFATEQAMKDAWSKIDGPLSSEDSEKISKAYHTALLSTHEAWVGGVPGDAQPCGGDVGAPLLRPATSGFELIGVAGMPYATEKGGCPTIGAPFSILGPTELAFVKAREFDPACKGESVRGHCDGDTAVRCTHPNEGLRRIVKTNCATTGLRCVIRSNEFAGCE